MVTDQQVRRLLKLLQQEGTVALAAAKAGMDEKTARKYRRIGKLPSETKKARWWRTREDLFKDVWPQIEQILKQDASVEAVTIFDYLSRTYEGRFREGQLRSLQKRIKVWRALQGEPKEVMFPQIHKPGEQGQSDFTYMNELVITIAGQQFDHLFYHFILPYSNWETGMICFSESFESLVKGLQNALWELGGVPQRHRTDSLSAAFNNLSGQDELRERYKGLLQHYGMSPSHCNPGRSHENGDVEQSHHQWKRGVAQELILRGSRDFSSREEYEAFLRRLLKRRNSARQQKLAEEVAVLRPLPTKRIDDFTKLAVRVSRNATIAVKQNTYSVNSQLIGETIEARVTAETVEVWYGGQMVHCLPRLRGVRKHLIDYRHIIHSLVKKPGAFLNYVYQQDLFPRLLFRVAYDWLTLHYPQTATRQYLKILELAATVSEERVDEILAYLVARGEALTAERVRQLLFDKAEPVQIQLIEITSVQLSDYDSLLELEEIKP